MAKEPSSRTRVPPVEAGEVPRKPGKSRCISPKESMREHIFDSRVKENIPKEQPRVVTSMSSFI
jgi:hypothetical protein